MTTAHLHVLRRAVALLWGALVVVVLGTFAFGALVSLIGPRSFVITGGSMEPAIHTGSIIVVAPVDPEAIAVGDIITLRGDNGVDVTHRVTKVSSDDGSPVFEVKGDANATPDAVQVPARAVLGRLVFSVPLLGYLSVFLSHPSGLIAALAAAGLLFLLHELLESLEVDRRAAARAESSNSVAPEGS